MMDSGYVYCAQHSVRPKVNPSPLGLKAAERTLVQNEWMEGKVPVIVATISFGMGVDKANVR